MVAKRLISRGTVALKTAACHTAATVATESANSAAGGGDRQSSAPVHQGSGIVTGL